MHNKIGILIVTLGAVLLLMALLLFGYNQYESLKAGEESENILQQVKTETPPIQQTLPENNESEEADEQEIPVIDIGDYDCIGYLSLPTLQLELPILTDWDYQKLKVAPCRQFGSAKTNDLVIAGHDYRHHFKKLSQIKIGDEVTFTEADGTVNQYQVKLVDVLKANNVDGVANSGYDLVLYTCTYDGRQRITVFLNRTELKNNTK